MFRKHFRIYYNNNNKEFNILPYLQLYKDRYFPTKGTGKLYIFRFVFLRFMFSIYYFTINSI
jgi:hypothetical protein